MSRSMTVTSDSFVSVNNCFTFNISRTVDVQNLQRTGKGVQKHRMQIVFLQNKRQNSYAFDRTACRNFGTYFSNFCLQCKTNSRRSSICPAEKNLNQSLFPMHLHVALKIRLPISILNAKVKCFGLPTSILEEGIHFFGPSNPVSDSRSTMKETLIFKNGCRQSFYRSNQTIVKVLPGHEFVSGYHRSICLCQLCQ